MRNLLKTYLVCSLILITFQANAQVNKATYDEAVDYINCRISELSFRDQAKQPHLVDFQTASNKCDMSSFKGSFHTTLKAFLTQRSLIKNQALATYIQTLKTKYKPDYQADDLLTYLMDTLMTAPTFKTFEGKHQLSYPSMEEELTKDIFELFGLAAREVEFDDENNVIEGEIKTFTDSTNTYLQQDGGVANEELYSEEGERKPTIEQRNKDNVLVNQDRSFFDKYRWAIFAILILGAIGYWWFTRGGFSKISAPSTNNTSPKSKTSSGEVDQLNTQLDELRATGVSLQEEVDVLRFRVKEFENRLLYKKEVDIIETIEPETDQNQPVLIEDVKSDVISQNLILEEDNFPGDLVKMIQGEAFFMPIPNAYGIFDLKEATAVFKRPYSVYLFKVISEDGNQAEFSIYEDIATMLRALDNFDEYLRPACRSTAILHKNATKIITEEKGLAIREGKEWKVVTKAVVRYG
jgi:hypothetical protein